jgi:hypothetical protein
VELAHQEYGQALHEVIMWARRPNGKKAVVDVKSKYELLVDSDLFHQGFHPDEIKELIMTYRGMQNDGVDERQKT